MAANNKPAGGAKHADADRADIIFNAQVEILKGTLDRARAGAEFVRNASATILTIYQAILGAGFITKDVPVRLSAVLGTTFLALAVAGATGYVAWFGSPRIDKHAKPTDPGVSSGSPQLDEFARWVNQAVLSRVAWLRFAVVSLVLGAIALPLPFVQVNGVNLNDPVLVLGLLLGGVVAAVVVAWATRRRGDPPSTPLNIS
jgi:hypothetical protein